ncbi:MAG: microcin ABC transporter permease, partial [Pantoea sp.]|nr:microcin ABC transporter permease [Pantoea sp.]
MGAYFLRRLLLIIPTLWAIITLNFFIVQIAPGGPVDQALANIQFGQTTGLAGGGADSAGSRASLNALNPADNQYRGARGLDP